MDTTLKKQHPIKFIEINIQNKKAMLKVKEDLISSKIYEKLDISPMADTNRNYNIILDEINQAKNKYIMSKLVKFNKYKHKKSTWITQGLLAPIRHRDKLYKKIKLTNPDSREHEMLLINLKTYNVILKRSFRIGKQSYFETRFNSLHCHTAVDHSVDETPCFSDSLEVFEPTNTAEIASILANTDKTCTLDPLPTKQLKDNI